MSKIICDVCGTSYPETANQCPICGCVRPGDAVTVRGDTNEVETAAAGTYIYVKGGRFSKKNVKKHNQGKPAPSVSAAQMEAAPRKKGKSDKGIVITILALLLAIVAIAVYIAIRFFLPDLIQFNNPIQNTQQTVNTTEATIKEIPCTALQLSDTVIEFDKLGAALLLNVTPTPADTTDEISYATSDETVAAVSEDGKVVAMGSGEAVITITCGTATAECRVVCTMEAPTEPTTEATYPTDDFKLNREDFTLNRYGDTWTLYKGDIPADVITWTSDNEQVATFKDGVVTAVGAGSTTVYAEYGDIKLSCRVHCASTVKTTVEKAYKISHTDVTIDIGEIFILTLKDKQGKTVDVSWDVEDSSICTVSGSEVTGAKSGVTRVSVTIDGETYWCKVIVK